MKHIKSYLIILILILIVLLIKYAGVLLVNSDEPKRADVAFVLMGGLPVRIMEAVHLYNDGYVTKIVMAEEDRSNFKNLNSQGIFVPSEADLCKDIAIQLGVLEEDILIIKGYDTLSTQDEAIAFKDYLFEHHETNTALLVTSNYHSKRASKIMNKAFKRLDRDIELVSVPSRYSDFSPASWYKDREDIQKIVTELIKFTVYYLKEQFEL